MLQTKINTEFLVVNLKLAAPRGIRTHNNRVGAGRDTISPETHLAPGERLELPTRGFGDRCSSN